MRLVLGAGMTSKALAQLEGRSRLIVVSDGALNGLPFALLGMPDGVGRVVDHSNLVVAPSIGVLEALDHRVRRPGLVTLTFRRA